MIILNEAFGSVSIKCEECNKKHYIYIKNNLKKIDIGYEFHTPFKCNCGKVYTIIKYSYLDNDGQVICPKCSSTQITANKKGFGLGKALTGGAIFGEVGLLGGFIKSNKIKITCLKCGYEWDVGNTC